MRVVVVGAGVIGLAIADRMARHGAAVTVLDMRAPGRGASQASAGILAPYGEAHAGSPLLALGVRSLALYDDFIGALEESSGQRVEYARTGTLDVALTESECAALASRRTWLDHSGVPCEWMSGRSLRTFEPAVSEQAAGALWVGIHGFVAVPSLVEALAISATRSGATLLNGVEVHAIDSTPSTVLIRTRGKSHEADRIVLAAGSWSGQIDLGPSISLRTTPVRGQLLVTTWPDAGPPSRVVWGSACYTVPWPDGTLLVGASVEHAGFDESPTPDATAVLTSALHALLPAARRATLREVRVGLRPALADGLPAIGAFAAAPRVIAATGHYRNGILLAPLTAALVTSLIMDGAADEALEITSPDRGGLEPAGD